MSAVQIRRFPAGWLGGLGCGALIMVNPATVVFLAVLLAPSMLMRVSDDRPERAGTTAVLMCNVAAVVGPFCRLWHETPPGLAHALDMLSRMTVIAWAWLAAGVGWLVSEGLIFAAGRWLTLRDNRATQRLDAELGGLVAEWGDPSSREGEAA